MLFLNIGLNIKCKIINLKYLFLGVWMNYMCYVICNFWYLELLFFFYLEVKLRRCYCERVKVLIRNRVFKNINRGEN